MSQRVRCVVTGHDWRRAIAPRQGYYLRCRRCWNHRPVDDAVEQVEKPSWVQTPAVDRAA